MKYAYSFLAAALIVLSSCSSTYQARNTGSEDDVYYSPGSTPAELPASTGQTQTQTTQPSPSDYTTAEQPSDERFQYTEDGQYTDENGNTYITNNYYVDDYYDYSYSSRIRRFHRPAGFGYYHSYYTNSYWYDYYPPSYGVSIYIGYNWWPSPGCIRYPFYYGYHCPSPYYYGYYYNPGYYWHSWNYGYGYWGGYHHGYWNGYNHGYWDGYHAGLHNGYYSQPYYFNSYDHTSYYYGPRDNTGSNNVTAPPTLTQTYTAAAEKGIVPVNPKGDYNLSAEQVKNITKQDADNFYTTPKSTVKGEITSPATVKPSVKGETAPSKTDDYTPAVKPGKQAETTPKNEPLNQPKPVVPKQQPVKQKDETAPSTQPTPKAQPADKDNQVKPQQQPQPTDRNESKPQTQPSERGNQNQPQQKPNRYQQGPSMQNYSAPAEQEYNYVRPNIKTPSPTEYKAPSSQPEPRQPRSKSKYQPQPQPEKQKSSPAPKDDNRGNYQKSSRPSSSQPSRSAPSNRGSSGGSDNSRPSRGR